MSLIEALKTLPQSSRLRQQLAIIDAEDFSRVATKAQRDLGGAASTYVNQGIDQLKRYYALALMEPGASHAVSMPVDAFWHSHILFSRDYTAFCDKVFGGYLHHEPLDTEDTAAVDHVRHLYAETCALHRRYFDPVDTAWLPAADSVNALICYGPRM